MTTCICKFILERKNNNNETNPNKPQINCQHTQIVQQVAATHRSSDRRALKTGSRAGTRLSLRWKTSFPIGIRTFHWRQSGGVTALQFPWLPLPRAELMRSRDGTRVQEATVPLQPHWDFALLLKLLHEIARVGQLSPKRQQGAPEIQRKQNVEC